MSGEIAVARLNAAWGSPGSLIRQLALVR